MPSTRLPSRRRGPCRWQRRDMISSPIQCMAASRWAISTYCPLPVRVARRERGQHCRGAVEAAHRVEIGRPGRHRPAVAIADEARHAGHQFHARSERDMAADRSANSVSGHLGNDQARIAGVKLGPAQPHPIQRADAEIGHQHVGAISKATNDVEAGLGLEVDDQAPLVVVLRVELVTAVERPFAGNAVGVAGTMAAADRPAPVIDASGSFDLDDRTHRGRRGSASPSDRTTPSLGRRLRIPSRGRRSAGALSAADPSGRADIDHDAGSVSPPTCSGARTMVLLRRIAHPKHRTEARQFAGPAGRFQNPRAMSCGSVRNSLGAIAWQRRPARADRQPRRRRGGVSPAAFEFGNELGPVAEARGLVARSADRRQDRQGRGRGKPPASDCRR